MAVAFDLWNAGLILDVLTLAAVFILIRWWLPGYFKERAKNLATKQDIAEITHQIEAVKSQYARQLEEVRTALGSQLYIHQTRYTKEFGRSLASSCGVL